MAEFLVFDKDNWMDRLTSERWTEMSQRTHWAEKYAARYQKGDVVEVRPDGFWTGPKARGFDQEAFKVVSIPGLAPDPVYMEPKVQVNMVVEPETGKLMHHETRLRKRKWRFPIMPSGKIVVLSMFTAEQV